MAPRQDHRRSAGDQEYRYRRRIGVAAGEGPLLGPGRGCHQGCDPELPGKTGRTRGGRRTGRRVMIEGEPSGVSPRVKRRGLIIKPATLHPRAYARRLAKLIAAGDRIYWQLIPRRSVSWRL